MANPTMRMTATQLYKEAGLIYIRYNATIEDKPNGQRKIGGTRPAFSKIDKQMDYAAGSGRYYSLLMGREIKPGQFAILLDFDNKDEGDVKSGMEVAAKLNIDQYKAPKQKTPSGGLHYIFWVDGSNHIKSATGVSYDGGKYNMDVKFKNGLCNCAPSKIEGYGEYKWVNPYKLLTIPKLPDEIYDVIRNNTIRKIPTFHNPTAIADDQKKTATKKELEGITSLCSCITASQMDNWETWSKLGLILKNLGAPIDVWIEQSKKSKKFKMNECEYKWARFKIYGYTFNSLVAMAKDGNVDEFDKISRRAGALPITGPGPVIGSSRCTPGGAARPQSPNLSLIHI